MKNDAARNFVFGVIAGGGALLVAAIFRMITGGLFVPELASQTLFSLTPGQVESFSVETFGSLAKYSAFASAIIVNLIIYGILALLLHKIYLILGSRRLVVNLLQLSFIPYFVMASISAILLQLNELLTGSSEIQYALLFLLLPNVAYGRTLSYLFQRDTATKRVDAQKPSVADAEAGEKPDVAAVSSVPRISRKQFITMGADRKSVV